MIHVLDPLGPKIWDQGTLEKSQGTKIFGSIFCSKYSRNMLFHKILGVISQNLIIPCRNKRDDRVRSTNMLHAIPLDILLSAQRIHKKTSLNASCNSIRSHTEQWTHCCRCPNPADTCNCCCVPTTRSFCCVFRWDSVVDGVQCCHGVQLCCCNRDGKMQPQKKPHGTRHRSHWGFCGQMIPSLLPPLLLYTGVFVFTVTFSCHLECILQALFLSTFFGVFQDLGSTP